MKIFNKFNLEFLYCIFFLFGSFSYGKSATGCITFYQIKSKTNSPYFNLRIEPKSIPDDKCICTPELYEFRVKHLRVSDEMYVCIYGYISKYAREKSEIFNDNRFQYAVAISNPTFKLFYLSYKKTEAIDYIDNLECILLNNKSFNTEEVQLVIKYLNRIKNEFDY